ncbi:MAG: succinoglycan biosynthesis transport protein ExoP [Pseudoalteromonas tetraodonis]|jgi:succinoglycan biosynthesis transport protein ExoP
MGANSRSSHSGDLAGKAISNGILLLKHTRLGVILMVFALTAGLTLYVYTKPVFYAKALIKFNILNLPVHADSAGANTPYFRLERSLIRDLQSRHLIERTAKRLGLVETTGTFSTISEQFVKAVTVERLDSYKLKITVQPYSAELAEVFAEAMVHEYEDYQLQLRLEYGEQAVATYTRELDELRTKLRESLEERLKFESDTDFATKSLEAAEYHQVLTDLYVIRQQLRSGERAERALSGSTLSPLEKIARLALFNSEINSNVDPVITARDRNKGPIRVTPTKSDTILLETGAATAAQWQALQSKKDEYEAAQEELAKTFLKDHAEMKTIEQKISLHAKRIDAEAQAAESNFRSQYSQMKLTERSLEGKREAGEDAVGQLSKDQLEIQLIEGKLPWEKAYEEVQARLESLDFGAGKERIILAYERLEKVRRTPTSPNKLKLFYAAIALGLALAFGVPIGLEHINDTASKIDVLERELNLKGLGIVPVTNKGDLEDIVRSPEVDSRIPNSLLENFRIIRSGIALNSDNEQGSQVIMVTSARPSEGKTVNSCNLGWAFASINEPTLLIDSDLRRGRVHKVLDVPNKVGLSSVLMKGIPVEEAIQPTKVPNLWVLTRGPIIAGSTERLCIPEHEIRMQSLRTRFARIIMDTPPVLGLSETSSLMRLVDGVVMIIRAERTTRRDVNAAATTLRKAGAKFFGFVLNRLDLSQLSNYYNYYYYASYYYDNLIDDDPELEEQAQGLSELRKRAPEKRRQKQSPNRPRPMEAEHKSQHFD